MKLMDIVFVGVVAFGAGFVFAHLNRPRWDLYSVRMEDGHKPVPVREMKPYGSGAYQEYRSGRWVDVPYEERGPHYMEKYPR